MPAVGYKCESCITNNSSLATKSRMGVTAEMNARANDAAERRYGHSNEENDYRNIRG